MRGFLFITDTHITTSCPFRVGDPLEDVLDKLEQVRKYAHDHQLQVIHGGDLFDHPTVPYEAYSAVVNKLRDFFYPVIAVMGNHDQLFRNDDNNRKTAFNALACSGVIRHLTSPIEFDDCILTPDKSLINKHKPQILLYHGFFNVKDGKCSVYPDDVAGVTTPTLVLLGHDHVEYEPIDLGAVKIYRIGSLFRNRRVVTSDRAPKMLEILIKDGKFECNLIPLKCKSATEAFREVAGKGEVKRTDDYMGLIAELQNVTNDSSDLLSVVSNLAEPRVYSYIEEQLNTAKLIKQH